MNHEPANEAVAAVYIIFFILFYVGIPVWWRWGDLIIAIFLGKKEHLHEEDICKESADKTFKEWRARQRSWRRKHGSWNNQDIWKG